MRTVHPDRPAFIYTLSCPFTGSVRYLGKTFDLKQRYAYHLGCARRGSFAQRHCSNWIRTLLAQNAEPVLTVVEETTGLHACDREREWVARLRREGVDLTNLTDGGDGTQGKVWREESKQGLFEKRSLRYIVTTPEGGELQIKGLAAFCRERGINRSGLCKALRGEKEDYNGWRIRYADGGKGLSVEHRRQLGESRRGKPLSDETRAKMSAAHLGKKASALHCEKMRASMIGREVTWGEKISKSMAGGYVITTPEGDEIRFTNLVAFCAGSGLNRQSMQRILTGKTPHVKGWRIRRAVWREGGWQ